MQPPARRVPWVFRFGYPVFERFGAAPRNIFWTRYGVSYSKGWFCLSVFSAYDTFMVVSGLRSGGNLLRIVPHKKTAREKLLVARNGHPPDVGRPPRPVRMGSDHPEGTKDAFDHPAQGGPNSPFK